MVEITVDMLKNANVYVPLMQKEKLANDIAPLCVAQVTLTMGETAYPDRYQENEIMTRMCTMGILAQLYLKQDFGLPEGDMQLAANVYDEWAGSHVMNQLERLKSVKDEGIKEKVFDLLYDYKSFVMMINHAIANLLSHKNDVVVRLAQYMEKQAELLPKDLEAIGQLKEELEKVKGEQNGG